MTGKSENEFWAYSLRVYADSRVQAYCLEQQDARSIDVNILLFWLWLGYERSLVATSAAMLEGEKLVHSWHENVVRRLRSTRSWMKGNVVTPDAPRLRDSIKAAELAAEKIEQEMLFAWAQAGLPLQQAKDAGLLNEKALVERYGVTAMEPDVAALFQKAAL